MKYRSILFLFMAVMCSLPADAQQWKQNLTYSYSDFADVYFVDASLAYGVGSFGQVAKTTDGGTTWTMQTSGVASALSSVAFLDANTGFLVGPNRLLIRTVNGGTTWAVDTVRVIPETAAGIRAIQFLNKTTGFILSSETSKSGRILKTTDAGATWTTVLNTAAEEFYDFSFNGTNAIMVGKGASVIYYSTNSGDTWTKATAAPLGGFVYTRSDIRAVHLVSSSIAYAVGWGSNIGAQPAIIIKSVDGGKTWTYLPQTPAITLYDNLNAVYFKDDMNGIAVGGAILTTTDGGTTWKYNDYPIGSTLNSVGGIGSSILITGTGGNILSSPDLGVTITNKTKVPASALYTIQFPTATTGYAAGFDGLVIKTTDGGKSWTPKYARVGLKASTIQKLQFLDDKIGFVSCSNRSVLKTTDGGATWSMILPDTSSATAYSYGLYFANAATGYVVGQQKANTDIIWRTTDGGATWSFTTGTVLKALRDVAFGSAAKGVAAGDGMKIAYTTDAGVTWKAATINGLPTSLAAVNLRKVKFIDADNAVAIGGKAILKSADAGATWAYVDSVNTDLYDLNFLATPSGTGFAVGTKFVMKTTNGGASWTNIIDTNVVRGTLNSCTSDPAGNMWIGGASTTIFTTSSVTSVRPVSDVAPTGYALGQNYPNPFNPSTQITFALPVSERVSLTVYDLLGRTVATLVNGAVNAGTYTVDWNAAGVSSGVYLYRFQSGSYSNTKKLILQK